MTYQNLRDFLTALDQAGELKHITQEVSPYLDISKFTDAESKSKDGGKGLFFENVKDSEFPVVTNIFGSMKRICMAFGVKNLDEPAHRIREFIEFNPPKNFKDILNILPMAISVPQFFPRMMKSKTPPCQEVVMTGDKIDLSTLPVLHCWPKDAGRFITLPMVFTKSLESGRRNVGMYRMQIFDKNTTGMHWHIHKDGSHYYTEYCRAKKRMPVAVAIGADPATIFSATAPMPRGVDELLLAGFLRKKPVMLTKCLTIDMEGPAEDEFVIEGYVDPGELRREGPFGDHTGYYSLADDYPVFHVTAITHRKNPIYSATLVGKPPMEDCYLAKATERFFLPLLQTVFPEIRDYWLPWEGVFHNIVAVSIDKEYPGHAQKIMSGLWGQGQMSFCKAIVVADKEVNVQNPDEIIEKLLHSFDISSDITLTKGVLDVLDHSSPFPNYGHKIGIDLTKRCQDEPPRTPPPAPSPKRRGGGNNVSPLLSEEGLGERSIPGVIAFRDLFPEYSESINRISALSVEKAANRGGKAFAEEIFADSSLKPFNIIILYDKDIDIRDNSLILWKLFNNTDPGRDMIFQGHQVVIDACKKGAMDGHEREWPDDLSFEV